MDTTGGETITGVSSVRVISDDFLPNTTRSVSIRHTFSNDPDKSFGQTLLNGIQGGMAAKAKKLYKYSHSGDYYYGPTLSNALNSYVNHTAVLDQLETVAGYPVDILYYKLAPINLLHVAWQRLVDVYGYDQVTNKITGINISGATDVYLQDIILVYTEDYYNSRNPEALQNWGRSPQAGYTPFRRVEAVEAKYDQDGNLISEERPAQVRTDFTPPVVDSNAVNNYALIRYVHITRGLMTNGSGGDRYTGEFVINLGTHAPGNYYQIKYCYATPANPLGVVKYWTYLAGSGTYPTIDNIDLDATGTFGQFYPMIFFRYKNQINLADPSLHQTDAYKSSKKACKYLGIDYKTLSDSIHENPDINKVTFSFMTFAVPMSATDQMELRYLFDFFNKLLQYTEINVDFPIRSQEEEISGIPDVDNYFFSVGNSNEEMPYMWNLVYGHISKKLVTGTIGDVGTYTSVQDTFPRDGYRAQVYTDGLGNTYTATPARGRFRYRYQITEGIYEEITVVGPKAVYRVTGKHFYGASYQDEALMIPLDHSIVSEYGFKDAEILYARSLRIVFSAADSVKQDWYESEAFRIFLTVVVLVISIITFNPAGAGWLSTTLGFTGVSALAVDILFTFAMNSALAYGFSKLAKELGLENAFAVAVVAYVVSIAAGGAGPNPGLPFAGELLQLANGLVLGIQSAVDEYMKEIQQELETYQNLIEEKQDAFEQAKNLLARDTNRELLDVLAYQPLTLFGESPQEYYQRTVHSGNVGVIGIDAVSSYVSNALSLPKLYQTIDEV